jgi:hypothetical protein
MILANVTYYKIEEVVYVKYALPFMSHLRKILQTLG